MFLQRSAVAVARRAAVSVSAPLLRRSIAATAVRRKLPVVLEKNPPAKCRRLAAKAELPAPSSCAAPSTDTDDGFCICRQRGPRPAQDQEFQRYAFFCLECSLRHGPRELLTSASGLDTLDT